MSWTQHIRQPSKILSVGEMVDAKVLNIDLEERKISLGLKQLEPDPWDGIELKYPVGSRQKGIVRNLTNFGAFVELEEGIDGLIHISDLSWTKKIRHPGEVVKKGEEIDVVVLNVDKGNRRISLGYKQTKDNPWDEFEAAYGVHTKTNGKVLRMIDKGLIVELPSQVDGFVPLSHLSKPNLAKPADGYAVGDELELVVIEFNKDNKKIILSEKLAKEPQGDGEGGKRKGKKGKGRPGEFSPGGTQPVEVKLTPEELAAAEEVAMANAAAAVPAEAVVEAPVAAVEPQLQP
jgi:small subunit ribosomal protein S1